MARQPIVDAKRVLVGYELLFRRGAAPGAGKLDDGSRATAQVLTDGVLVAGVRSLTAGVPAFINFTERLLLGRFGDLLVPPGSFVIEVLEDIEPAPDVIAECRRLRAAGYRVALDDVTSVSRIAAFSREFDVVKVDLGACEREVLPGLVSAAHAAGAKALAEKVEDEEMMAATVSLGFDYFQGYALGRPSTMARKTFGGIPAQRLRLLQVVSQPVISLDELEEVVLADPTLAYKVLAYANSARAAQRGRLDSVRAALVLFGQDEIRRAAGLVVLSGMTNGAPGYLLAQSLTLGRFCEEIAGLLGEREGAYRFALAGLLSNVDKLLGVPMEDAVAGLPLGDDLKGALLGAPGRLGSVVQLARTYEAGDWQAALGFAGELGVELSSLPASFQLASEHAHRLMAA